MGDGKHMENDKITGIVFEIERFAINDGPGIRTLVFLKGCPLKCRWCANPESQNVRAQIMLSPAKCIGCRTCIGVCENKALSWKERVILDREKCKLCGKCAGICNSEAIEIAGKAMTPEEVLAEVDKDARYYKSSGGGVTFSGGEVFNDPDFVFLLAQLAKARGYNTALETCGFAQWHNIERVIPYIDLFMYDFKCMDDDKHRYYTGVSNKIILKNYIRLVNAVGSKNQVVARVPVIPGINMTSENFSEMADFIEKHNPNSRIDLLPYHSLGKAKYDKLDKKYELEELAPPSKESMIEIQKFLLARGFNVTVGG